VATILLVDDDRAMLISLQELLEANGYTVVMAESGVEALQHVAQGGIDLAILDIMMPEMDGLEVCRRVRSDPLYTRLPILFLTAKGRSGEAAKALDSGGDDFIVKPFEVSELPARIRALLRRATGGTLDANTDKLVIRRLTLYTNRPEVSIEDRQILLTSVEYHLLYCLMNSVGKPVSTANLLQTVWGYPAGVGNPNLVQVHIANLRRKLGFAPEDPEYIRNVHGRGYLIAK
jgi:DNA-binding response OmpR family regulator